ncbi:MAG: ribonuclease HII [Gammaproteobacteria bacterium]
MIAGVDEAGRGPLAGPVVAAAVILDDARPLEGLADSKRLSPARRAALYECIAASALAVGVGRASVEEIDRLNIFRATLLAMERALAALALAPLRVVVDGTHTPRCACPAEAIVKGDATVPSIMAASIVAKVVRDRLMDELAREYPLYGFERHRGYGTPEHLAALGAHGPAPCHRRSFAPVRLTRVEPA